MKLRLGKVKPYTYKIGVLPEKLEDELDKKLQEFKELSINNVQHTKELLNVVSKAINGNSRFTIRDKIREVYNDETNLDRTVIEGMAGSLAWLVTGDSDFYKENNIEPKYHGIIQTKIENFALQEISLLGNMEE